jgi:hypothetical protein
VNTFTFLFALMQKESDKEKNQGCTSGVTPQLLLAKAQKLASLKQSALLNAKSSRSA